jgi:hypothetical protein
MDVGALSTSMAMSNAASSVTIGVMRDAQNLEQDLVARLFGSMGVGNAVDTYA